MDNSSQSRRGDDVPFRPCLNVRDGASIESALFLNEARSSRSQSMRHSLIANLLCARAQGGASIFYARDRNYYSDGAIQRYSPPFYTYRWMLEAVSDFERAGLIDDDRRPPRSDGCLRSRLRATPTFLRLTAEIPLAVVEKTVHEPIILRDEEKRLVDYHDSRHVSHLRQDVKAHNAFLQRYSITVTHPDCQALPDGTMLVRGEAVSPAQTYYRIFNRTFSHGGRWYGAWWQTLPGEIRKGIHIDGQPTVEVDIRCCHPRLLCASAAIPLPFEDPHFDFYAIPGFERRLIKVALNIMINAGTPLAARRAIDDALRTDRADNPWELAGQLMTAVNDNRPELRPYFSTGIGLRLQNIDAEVCARVQRALRLQGIPCLSVHDSFIVQHSHAAMLRDLLEHHFTRECAQLRRYPLPLKPQPAG